MLPAAAKGTAPFAAWEAELTAYARLRSGTPAVKVHFAYSTEAGWGDVIQLARAGSPAYFAVPGTDPPGVEPAMADSAPGPVSYRPPPSITPAQQKLFLTAELALEHALMHFRHGWREATLLWHAWAHPGETIRLPWPPWDQVALPASVVRLALREAVPALALPPETERWPPRLREAAVWITAAWADGQHRSLEVRARPGLAERLPLPGRPERPSTWEAVLYHLATQEDPPAAPTGAGAAWGAACEALEALTGLEGASELEAQCTHVLALIDALRRLEAIPPAHKQRPPWLQRDWGQWRRSPAVREALDHLARSPTSSVVALATAMGRRHASLPVGSGERLVLRGEAQGTSGAQGGATRPRQDEAAEGASQEAEGWGVQQGSALPHPGEAPVSHTTAPGREGQGDRGAVGLGAGPGALGALRVVSPTPEDRAAYWQLRGALAPEIERLIERLQAASDAYYACTPRRFQRSGRLDRNRLPAAMSGREATFVRFVQEPEPAHALCLLLDCSASMTTRAEQLREVAILVESAAAALGARVNAFAFGASWERVEPAAEGAPLVALGRELRPQGGTPFGPAVAAAAEWLSRQPYEQKRLWVFSDGLWSARDRDFANWRPELLRDAVVWVFTEPAPEPPTPAMRVVSAPTLARLVELAPRYFWDTSRYAVLPPGTGTPQGAGPLRT